MKLRDLLADEVGLEPGLADLDVSGLTADSRAVRPGDVFVALAGVKADGLQYVAPALANGAVAIIAERTPDALPNGVGFVKVDNARRTLAKAAAKLFPRQPSIIAAVTGTSGKTSVAAFTRQIWSALGHPAASVGTIGVVAPNEEIYGSLTTPDPIDLHRTLDRLAGDGVTHLALEASSHGLDQHRLDGVRIAVAGFTNLSRDHLDYHPSVEAYLQAKLRLFDDLVAPNGTAVIVTDHEHTQAVVAAAKARGLKILDVGHTASDDGIRIVEAVVDGFSQTLQLGYGGRNYRVRLPLVGGFQVENALVAAGFALATGGDPAKVFAALEGLEGAKGRLELAGQRAGAPIFIDYAHKPDALAKALEALRPYAPGRLVAVFGCGGDRDQGKRPLMGAIAAELADRVIVTDDNPRSENPNAIRRAILDAAPGAREIGDRRLAIRTAIAELAAGDVLLVAGKGHETGQIVGNEVLPFSDHEAVKTALEELAA
jgi:UDP-N-acetylmuramoyl-L-alanyl-D-glutamate--2,6-diaminopimelate ligase